MLVGTLGSWRSDRDWMHPVIRRAVDFLANTDFSTLEDGKYPIWGDEMYGRIMTLGAKTVQEQPAEVHRKFLDIHCLLDGAETIGWQPNDCLRVPIRAYDEEQDYALFDELQDEAFVFLKPGMYMILLPEEIHRPGLGEAAGAELRKVVVKIDQSLL